MRIIELITLALFAVLIVALVMLACVIAMKGAMFASLAVWTITAVALIVFCMLTDNNKK